MTALESFSAPSPRPRGRTDRLAAALDRETSTLVSRNVTVSGRRTSMRLEASMWDAFFDIAEREHTNLDNLCTRIDEQRQESSLTAAVRVFIMNYFRHAAGLLRSDADHLATAS
jgi:predicted DNA-binding ribbon-helix-helix protein